MSEVEDKDEYACWSFALMGYSTTERIDEVHQQELFDMLQGYSFPCFQCTCGYTTKLPTRSRGSSNSRLLLCIFNYIRAMLPAAVREDDGHLCMTVIKYVRLGYPRSRFEDSGHCMLLYNGGLERGTLTVRSWMDYMGGCQHCCSSKHTFRYVVKGAYGLISVRYEIDVHD